MDDGTSVGALKYDVNLDDKDLQSQLDNADQNVQKLGASADDSFAKFQQGAKVAATGLAVVGVGLTAYSKNAIDFTEDLVKSSKSLGTQIGVSTTEASQLVAAFGRMGIAADSASQMFGIFSKQITAAQNSSESDRIAQESLAIQVKQTQADIKDTTAEIKKNGDASGELGLKVDSLKNKLSGLEDQQQQSGNAFEQLGISLTNADGTAASFTTILGETADKFKAMPDGVEKTTLAMQLFGRSGKDMIKVLNLGSAGIQDLEKQADALGLTLNAGTITSINKLINVQKDLKEQTDAMKIAVGTATAPVLANFDTKVNDMVGHLLNAHGAIHTATVDVLAFGGPVAGAASAIIGFAANLDQAQAILMKLGTGLSGMVELMRSPWVLAFVAAGVAVAAVTSFLFSSTTQSSQLSAAYQKLNTDTNNLRTAQDNLSSAQLNQKGAALQVEAAQDNYNQAVANYGPTSLPARQAAYDLQVAQQNLAAATLDVKNKTIDASNAQKTVAKDDTYIDHLKNIKDATDDITRSSDGAVISINKLASSVSSNNAVGKKIDLTPLLKKAAGGPVMESQQYLVGEKGPELFVPSQNGTIIPADLTRQMMNQGGAPSQPLPNQFGGSSTINIGQINNKQDEDYVIRRLNRNQQLESFGMSPVGG